MNQETTGDKGNRCFLLVRVGALSCALPASDVVRVVRGLPCHPVPGSQAHLIGLAQYGGEPLPVLDLHALVEGGVSGVRHRSTVILGRGRRRDRSVLGLAVDDALRIVDLPDTAATDGALELVTDSVEVEGEAVKVLNTERLLGGERNEAGEIDG